MNLALPITVKRDLERCRLESVKCSKALPDEVFNLPSWSDEGLFISSCSLFISNLVKLTQVFCLSDRLKFIMGFHLALIQDYTPNTQIRAIIRYGTVNFKKVLLQPTTLHTENHRFSWIGRSPFRRT